MINTDKVTREAIKRALVMDIVDKITSLHRKTSQLQPSNSPTTLLNILKSVLEECEEIMKAVKQAEELKGTWG